MLTALTQRVLLRTDSTVQELTTAFQDLLGMQAVYSVDTNNLSQGPGLDEALVQAICGALDRIATTPNPSQGEARLTALLLRCVINKHARLLL